MKFFTGLVLTLLVLGVQAENPDAGAALAGLIVVGVMVALIAFCAIIVCICRCLGWMCCGRTSQNVTVHNVMPPPHPSSGGYENV